MSEKETAALVAALNTANEMNKGLLARLEAMSLVVPKAPVPQTDPDEQFRQMVAAQRGIGQNFTKCTLIADVVCPDTGCIFDAYIEECAVFDHLGKVAGHHPPICKGLPNFRYPAGIDMHVSEGGLVPDGLMIRTPGTGAEAPEYKRWRYEEFWKYCLAKYVGKPLPKHVRPSDTIPAPAPQDAPAKVASK